MNDKVSIAIILCITLLLETLMIRSAIARLAAARKEGFVFEVRFLGAILKLARKSSIATDETGKRKKKGNERPESTGSG